MTLYRKSNGNGDMPHIGRLTMVLSTILSAPGSCSIQN